MQKSFQLSLAAACAMVAGMMLSACSTTPMPSIGSINPFGGNKVSDVDRAYLQAAGSWDTNHDNVVTCNEWKSYTEDLFNGADVDHDDSLDASEWGHLVSIDRYSKRRTCDTTMRTATVRSRAPNSSISRTRPSC